jgi:colicin import membrane protein
MALDTLPKTYYRKRSYLVVEVQKVESKMTNENVEKAKADAKKGMADIGDKMAHGMADAKADVEKVKANFGHSGAEKQVDYAKADIKADAEKAKADIKANAQKAKADVEKKH